MASVFIFYVQCNVTKVIIVVLILRLIICVVVKFLWLRILTIN